MKKLLCYTALGAVIMCSQANAAGFHLKEQSAAAQGNAFAGATAGAEDISYSFFNPAGLTRHKGTKTSFGGTYIAPRAKAKTATGTNNYNPPNPNTQTDYVGNIVHPAVSPYFYFSHQLNNKWTAAVSMNTPYGMITSYDSDWAGRFHGTKSDIKTLTLTPMMAYKANDKLSFGAGFQMQYVKAKLSNAQIIQGVGEDAVKLQGDTFDIGYTLGAMYEYSDKTRFGVGYRSQIKHKLKGDIAFDKATFMNQDITARLTTPASLTFGAYHDINDQWSVMAEIGRVYWSSFDELRIKGTKNIGGTTLNSVTEEKWKDTTSYAIGASYRVNDQWKLRAGFAIDSGAVGDEYRTPRIPEADRYWYSGGVEYGINEKTTLNVGYTYIRAEKGKVDLKGNHPGDEYRGSIKAKYENDVHILAVGFNYNF